MARTTRSRQAAGIETGLRRRPPAAGGVKLTDDAQHCANQQRVAPFDVVDEVNLLTNRPARTRVDLDGSQVSGPNLVGHAPPRQDTDTLAHRRNTLDRLVGGDLHRDLHANAVRRALLLDQGARRRASFAENQRLSCKLRD